MVSRALALGTLLMLGLLGAGCLAQLSYQEEELDEDGGRVAQSNPDHKVVVLGGGAAGVGAAIAAARQGMRVTLVAELPRLGGLISSGVSRTDVGTIKEVEPSKENPHPVPTRAHATSGLFEQLRRKVAARYAGLGLPYSSGLYYEPDLAAELIQQMVDSTPGIELLTGYRLKEQGGVQLQGRRVVSIVVVKGAESRTLTAPVFIDATESGDLLGQAGARDSDWVVGREYRSKSEETLAPDLPGSGDDLIQAYNFRVTAQHNGVPVPRPDDYQSFRPRYQAVFGKSTSYSCSSGGVTYSGIWIQGCLPNGKMDLNLDLIGENHEYPTGSLATRQAIHQRLKNFALGWIHFLATEKGMTKLGLSRDDYEDTGNFPPVLYVREARRAVGTYVFRQADAQAPQGQCRPPLRQDAIAVGDYGMDTHCLTAGTQSGDFPCGAFPWTGSHPYQVPFGVLVPQRIDSLLVAHAVSATHVGYSTLRMEPIRMNLGQAAGVAAALAVRQGQQPRAVPVRQVQLVLAREKQSLLYFNDLHANHPDFAAIQGLVARGALEGDTSCRLQPDATLSRGHLAKMAVRALGLPLTSSGGPHFKDVPPSHPLYAYIETLYQRGVVGGYSDGTFGPTAAVSRGALAKIVALGAKFPLVKSATSHFGDISLGHWASPYAETLYKHKLLKGPNLSPDAAATRALAARLLDGAARLLGR